MGFLDNLRAGVRAVAGDVPPPIPQRRRLLGGTRLVAGGAGPVQVNVTDATWLPNDSTRGAVAGLAVAASLDLVTFEAAGQERLCGLTVSASRWALFEVLVEGVVKFSLRVESGAPSQPVEVNIPVAAGQEVKVRGTNLSDQGAVDLDATLTRRV